MPNKNMPEVKQHAVCHTCVKTAMFTIASLLMIGVLFLAIMQARNLKREYDYIGRSPAPDNSIMISGTAKEVVIPDVAKLSVGVFTISPTVSAAQNQNSTRMNAIIDAVKKMGIEAKDIKTTNYNVGPEYDWSSGSSVLKGYRVSQDIELTIRKIEKASDVLGAVTPLGANSVGNLQFVIDDIEAVRAKARIAAFENAKVKAEALAKTLNVKLGRIIGFSEDQGYYPQPIYSGKSLDMGMSESIAPSIEPGSNEVNATVNITYELL